MNKETIEGNNWLTLSGPSCENGVIETIHEDGVKDVARMIDETIYEFDKGTV